MDPNQMDAKAVLEMSKWVIAELVRIFHNLTTVDATQVVDALAERTVPVVWEVEGRRRVLDPALSKKDQTLLLLYSVEGAVNEGDLASWVEHSNRSTYRRDVLRRAHKERLIEYDEGAARVRISPTGIAYVE